MMFGYAKKTLISSKLFYFLQLANDSGSPGAVFAYAEIVVCDHMQANA